MSFEKVAFDFLGQYFDPIIKHEHYYQSVCCTAPIMEGSEVAIDSERIERWTSRLTFTRGYGYCSACQDFNPVECADCQYIMDNYPQRFTNQGRYESQGT